MNEIRTSMPIPGTPSSPTAIANKKDDASLHEKCSNYFNLSSLSLLTNKKNSASLKINSTASYIQQEYFYNH